MKLPAFVRLIVSFAVAFVSICLVSAASTASAQTPLLRTLDDSPSASITFDFALYFAPTPTSDPEAKLAGLLKADFKQLAALGAVSTRWEKTADYAPPAPQSMKHFTRGITEKELVPLNDAPRVFVITFKSTPPKIMPFNRHASALLAALADATGGLPWDEECRLLFSVEKWRELRVTPWEGDVPEMNLQINMHAYRDPELIRVITLGMRKFGLPDLALSDVGPNNTRSAGNLINALAQRLAEGARPASAKIELAAADIRNNNARENALAAPYKDAKHRVSISVTPVRPHEGDPDNALWSLDFPTFKLNTVTLRQSAAFSEFFGSFDQVTPAKHDDAELLAASERARKEFYTAAPQFRKGLQPDEQLLIKTRFKFGDDSEYMWVEVVKWNAKSVEGILVNDSLYDTSYRVGRRVTIDLKDVYDYLHRRPDGTSAGNETGKVLEAREKK